MPWIAMLHDWIQNDVVVVSFNISVIKVHYRVYRVKWLTGTNVRFQSGLAAAPVVCLILKHHKATTFSVYGTRTRDIVLSNPCVQAKLEEVKKTYGDAVKDLEPMTVTRPPKTEPAKPAEPAPAAAPAPAPEAAKA